MNDERCTPGPWIAIGGMGRFRRDKSLIPHRDCIVEVQFRDGNIAKGPVDIFEWRCTFGDRDVMAYRIMSFGRAAIQAYKKG